MEFSCHQSSSHLEFLSLRNFHLCSIFDTWVWSPSPHSGTTTILDLDLPESDNDWFIPMLCWQKVVVFKQHQHCYRSLKLSSLCIYDEILTPGILVWLWILYEDLKAMYRFCYSVICYSVKASQSQLCMLTTRVWVLTLSYSLWKRARVFAKLGYLDAFCH